MVDAIQEVVPNLVVDAEAQSKSITELRGVPHYQLEELILQHKLDLTVEGVVLVGIGGDGIGFKLENKAGEKSFLKIFRFREVPQPVLMDFIQKSGIHRISDGNEVSEEEFQKKLKEWTSDKFGDLEDGKKSEEERKLFERQALGIKKGSELLPNRVPKLQAIWTWNGEPVAISTELKEGSVESIGKWNTAYENDIETLRKNRILVDVFGKNSIRDKDNNVWFIDLQYFPEKTA